MEQEGVENSSVEVTTQINSLTALVENLRRELEELKRESGPSSQKQQEGRWGPCNLARTLEDLPDNQFLSIQESRDQIKGLSILPDDSEGRKPRIFDLHGEKHYGILTGKGAALGAREEYAVLYASLTYLSAANAVLEEEMGEAAKDPEDPELARLCATLHTYRGTEQLLRNRLGFIRFSQEEQTDRQLLQHVRKELFQPAAAGFGSDSLDKIIQGFEDQTRKQTIKSIAAASARGGEFSSTSSSPSTSKFKKRTGGSEPSKGGLPK